MHTTSSPDAGSSAALSHTIARLHRSYDEGNLEVLVGAGVSIPSGLPDWGTLNRRLLREFFKSDRPTGIPDDEELAVLAEVLEARFGASAAIDHVREELEGDNAVRTTATFTELLASAIYGEAQEFETSQIQYELAAWLAGSLPGLHTFNYDDLLERAYRKLTGKSASTVVRPQKTSDREKWVCHVHGYLPAGSSGRSESGLILSEKDYLKDTDGWADRRLKDVFECGKDVLLVGISLTDSRLRRHLFDRARSTERCEGSVFALMSRTTPDSELDLAHRKAEAVVDARTSRYWKQWNVEWLDAREHVRVPHLLRRIRLGDDVMGWLARSRAELPDRQRLAEQGGSTLKGLQSTVALLRHQFCIAQEERIRLTLWLPAPDPATAIRLTFDSGWNGEESARPMGARAVDEPPWELTLLDMEKAQGVAGHAFLEGVEIEASSGSPRMDQHFDPRMRARWKEARDFASLLCIPISAGKAWIPVGVACLSSNSRSPFWLRLDKAERVDLNVTLRSTFDQATSIARPL